MGFWRIKDYCPNPPDNPIQDWYDDQVEEIAVAFDFALHIVARTEDWKKSEIRPLVVPIEDPYVGLYKILVDVELSYQKEKRLIRPIGIWRPDSRDFIILLVSTEHGNDYDPPLIRALELQARWEKKEGETYDREV